MAEAVSPTRAHSTRRVFVRRTALSMFVAIPVVKSLAFPHSGSAMAPAPGQKSGFAMTPGPDVPDCETCEWREIGGFCGCGCDCVAFTYGPKWGCFDPHSGTLCICRCGGCSCCGISACLN